MVNPKAEDPDLPLTGSSSRFNFIIPWPVTQQGTAQYQWRELELENLSLSLNTIISCVPAGDCLQVPPAAQSPNDRIHTHIAASDDIQRRYFTLGSSVFVST